MAAKKSQGKRSSSGSDPKSKRIVRGKMQNTMHEFKHHELESGRSGKRVKNPKQAIAIGLSEARRAGANIAASPRKRAAAKKKSSGTASKRTAGRTTATKKATKKSAAKKTTAKKSATKKATKKSASKRTRR